MNPIPRQLSPSAADSEYPFDDVGGQAQSTSFTQDLLEQRALFVRIPTNEPEIHRVGGSLSRLPCLSFEPRIEVRPESDLVFIEP